MPVAPKTTTSRSGSLTRGTILRGRSRHALVPVLGEHPQRVASGGVLARSPYECRRAGRELVGLRQAHAVGRREYDGRGHRGERQVRGAEALAGEKRTPVAEQRGDPNEP